MIRKLFRWSIYIHTLKLNLSKILIHEYLHHNLKTFKDSVFQKLLSRNKTTEIGVRTKKTLEARTKRTFRGHLMEGNLSF